MTANQFQGDTDSGAAGERELVQRVMRLMLASSCFGREVCPTPPCACAQSLIDAITAARLPARERDVAEAICLATCRAATCVDNKKCCCPYPAPGYSWFEQHLIEARAVLVLPARLPATTQETAAEVERLAARLATHLSVKDSSPGFHLSDEDFRLIISALCATSLNARLATPPVQAPAAGVGDRTALLKCLRDGMPSLYELQKAANEIERLTQALADREAAARADEREQCAKIVELCVHPVAAGSTVDKYTEAIAAAIRARQP